MQTTNLATKSATLRARLGHPIIDSDAHAIEFEPTFLDYLKEVGGAKILHKYIELANCGWASWAKMSWQERRRNRAIPAYWVLPTKNTLDRATATLPKLLYERMSELGIDFMVIYPTIGLMFLELMPDDELRRACCRALNNFNADIYREHADRMTPVAVVPMHTPQEAIAELEHAVEVLGMKAILIAGHVFRPIPAICEKYPEAARKACWVDTFGLDSEYDYDPFWAKCVELQVPVASHSSGMGWGSRQSISSYIYNHLGHFAASAYALCASLFMGGITRRFPSLRIAFLECGVGWACSLYSDLIKHWEKRNVKGMENYNPANLDRKLYADLIAQYGGKLVEGKVDRIWQSYSLGWQDMPKEEIVLDEWARCEIERIEDIRDLFVPIFRLRGRRSDQRSGF